MAVITKVAAANETFEEKTLFIFIELSRTRNDELNKKYVDALYAIMFVEITPLDVGNNEHEQVVLNGFSDIFLHCLKFELPEEMIPHFGTSYIMGQKLVLTPAVPLQEMVRLYAFSQTCIFDSILLGKHLVRTISVVPNKLVLGGESTCAFGITTDTSTLELETGL